MRSAISRIFSSYITKHYLTELKEVAIRENTSLEGYHYQSDIAFSLSKLFKKSPIEIASEISIGINRENTEVFLCTESSPGFINIKLTTEFILKIIEEFTTDFRPKPNDQKTVVIDYSSPNVAKEMHVGHLRSTVIGDVIARVFEWCGHKVIRQNHIGDFGMQYGFLIEYIIENDLCDTLSTFDTDNSILFDYVIKSRHLLSKQISYLNGYYRESKAKFDCDQEFNDRARKRLVALQNNDPITLRIWKNLVQISIQYFQMIYKDLNVLLEETEIKGESFYSGKASANQEAGNGMIKEVVSLLLNAKIAIKKDDAVCIMLNGFNTHDGDPFPFIIQKSDGAYLYSTTDLAAIYWRIYNLKATQIIYVTDSRQKQHFEMLFKVANQAGWARDDLKLCHIAFGSVLDQNKKPFKTREGETIPLSLLLEEAKERASQIVASRNISEEQKAKIAQAIGIGALKYFDLRNDLVKDYVFDWDLMLSFDGNTIAYIQNAYVRIKSILRKSGLSEVVETLKCNIYNQHEEKLLIKGLEFQDVVLSIYIKLKPHYLCTYLYELCHLFHEFYENCNILREIDERKRNAKLAICYFISRVIKEALCLMGIATVEEM